MQNVSSQAALDIDKDFIDKIISRRNGRAGALLGILQKVQENNPRNFLPRDTLEYIAEKTRVPLSRIFSVVTFYALFNLEPQGRNTVCVCRGTACHTRGSRDLLEQVMMSLGLHAVEDGEAEKLSVTTADGGDDAAHRRLLRPVRAGASRRSQSRDFRSYERTVPAA